jgi:hypothetical protein
LNPVEHKHTGGIVNYIILFKADVLKDNSQQFEIFTKGSKFINKYTPSIQPDNIIKYSVKDYSDSIAWNDIVFISIS